MAEPRKRLGLLRGIFAGIGVIVMLLTGGCALTLLIGQGFNISDLEIILPYSAPPFLIGLGIWWLAVKVGRH